MKITNDTTLAEIARLDFREMRVTRTGTIHGVRIRDHAGRDFLGYGESLGEAIENANRNRLDWQKQSFARA